MRKLSASVLLNVPWRHSPDHTERNHIKPLSGWSACGLNSVHQTETDQWFGLLSHTRFKMYHIKIFTTLFVYINISFVYINVRFGNMNFLRALDYPFWYTSIKKNAAANAM